MRVGGTPHLVLPVRRTKEAHMHLSTGCSNTIKMMGEDI